MNRLDAKTQAQIVRCLVEGNFCRAHQTLTQDAGHKTTPAMAAGVADHVWTVEELLALMPEPTIAPWGSRKRAARVSAAGSN